MTQHHIRLFEFDEVEEKAGKIIRALWPGWSEFNNKQIAEALVNTGCFILFTKSGYPITRNELNTEVFGEYAPKRVFEVEGTVVIHATHCEKTNEGYRFTDGVFPVAATQLSSKVTVVI